MTRCRILCRTFMLVLIVTVCVISAASANPWPMFGYDSQHSGQSPYVGAQEATLKWSYPFGDGVFSEPVIDSNNVIYTITRDGVIYAIYPNGTLKWDFYSMGLGYGSLAIGNDGTIYRGVQNFGNKYDRILYAINQDGTLKWRFDTSADYSPAMGASTSITVGSDGTIYFIGINDQLRNVLYALNSDGSIRWNSIIEGNRHSAPAIADDGSIYLASEEVRGFDNNGVQKWNFAATEDSFYEQPIIGLDGTIYSIEYEPNPSLGEFNLVAINPDGTLKWRTFITLGDGSVLSRPVISIDGTIYLTGIFGIEILAVNSSDGSKKWEYETNEWFWPRTPAIGADGTIYICTEFANFSAINPDGTLKWVYVNEEQSTSVSYYAPVVIGSDGTVYVAKNSENGNHYLYAFGEDATTSRVQNINKGTDYTTIQAAIDDANQGDEIHVESGTYYETLSVNTELILRGIDTGAGKPVVHARGSDGIRLDADKITIEGFIITNYSTNGGPYAGIFVLSSYNILINNTMTLSPLSDMGSGISLLNSHNNKLIGNTISTHNSMGSFAGIDLFDANDNIIFGNIILNHSNGIGIVSSSNNILTNNIIIASNNSNSGMYVGRSNYNIIKNNTVINYYHHGIDVSDYSEYNSIFHNNIINNTQNAYDDSSTNQWDSGTEGNYYSDYPGTDLDRDGIGDTPYPIPGGSSVDRYPLMNPWTAPPLSGKIAFASFRDGNQEVYVMNANGTGDPIDLTNRPDADDGDPTWSPDGTQIAFSSNRSGNWTTYIMNADGSDQVCLLEGMYDAWGPAWSPDGTKIAVACKINPSDDFEIYTVDIQSRALTQVTDNIDADCHPSWSPDSHKIVFTSDRDGNQEIYVADILADTQTKLTDEPTYDDYPEWSPDGSMIAFVSERDGNPEIYSMVITSKVITRLTYSDSIDKHAQWSPDGQNIVFISDRDDGDMDIYVMKADGMGITCLVDWDGEETHPTWSLGHSSPPAYSVGEGAPDSTIEQLFIDAYNRNGGVGVLGNPATEVHYAWGYLVQDFPGVSGIPGGVIMYNDIRGVAYYIHGAIWERYYTFVNKSELGPVASDEGDAAILPQGTTGRFTKFETGTIHWISDKDDENVGHFRRGESFVTYGELDALYTSMGGTYSYLGFPVMDQEERDGHGYCEFEGGYIEWDEIEGKYKVLDFPTLSLTEDIDLTVSKTQDNLDGIMDEVQWCAEDGDYFSEKLEGDMWDIALDCIVDAIGVVGEVPGNNVDLHKIAFTGGEDTLYAHLMYLKHNNEYARDLFRNALLSHDFGGAGEVLKGASYYFAADFAQESIDEMAVGAFKISYKLNLAGDLALQEKFVPAVEKMIEGVYKTDLNDTKSSVLQNIPEFTSDEIELYEEDLTKRRRANLYLIDHLKRQNLILHHTQDIAGSEEGDWLGKIGMFVAKYGVKLGMLFLFDGPGVLVTEMAEFSWNVYENNAELNTDAQMMNLAIASNNNAFDTSRRIYTNTLRGLMNIENGVTPQIARGNIESIDNLVLAEYIFWGENNYACVTDVYSEVTIKNTGTSTTEYLLTAKYGVWGLLGTSYTPMTVPAALKISAGRTNTIRVKYYEDGKYGERPSDGNDIQFDLLGQTDTGLYYVGTASTNFYPHIPYTTSGTIKIVTSKDSIVSQEEMDGAEMISYPVRSVVKTPINSTNYTLEICVENPFDVPISVTLSQEMPNDTEIIDACGGTINENAISWNLAIEPEGYHMIAIIFTSHNAPGVVVEVPPVEIGIYDPINENMVDFQTNLYEFETRFPLRIMAFPPTNASIGEEIIVPINITSLLTDGPFSGNITLELVNSDNDTIYNLTEGFSLALGETQEINLVASPEIDPGIYIIKGTLQGTEASMNIFKEYISVDACYAIGTVLLQNRYNHNGTEVKLGNYNATTQPDGSYIFVGIPVGTYSLTMSHSGYLDYNEVMTADDGFNTIPEITLADITPPASITNPHPIAGITHLNWTWTNPPDPDFNHTELYLNGTFLTNIPVLQNYYNITGLLPDISYELSTRTVDTSGNINLTWVNDTASTLPASGTTLNLYTGWNLISLPLMSDDTSSTSILSPVSGNYSIVWAYNASDTTDHWKKYDPTTPFGNDLTTMEPGNGYWIMMTSDDTLNISRTMPAPTDIELWSGWNLIGYNSLNPQTITDALSSIDGNYSIIWAYNASDSTDHWKKYDPNTPFGNDLENMEPGKGYWIMMTAEDILEI